MKDKLLATGCFIENEWFNKYLILITKKTDIIGTEKHHILQKAYFKNLGLKIDNSKSNLVNLTYADHCKAHWYLYKCTKGFLKISNEVAFRRMVHDTIKFNINKGLTEKEYTELQNYWIELKNMDNNDYYTLEEEKYLIANFNIIGAKACATYLNRTYHGIIAKATKLGLRTKKINWWTEDQKNWLIQNDNKLTLKEKANYLNKSKNSIMGMRYRLGLVKRDNWWTEQDFKFLKENYAELGRWECARLLKRTERAVQYHASKLGLYEELRAIYCKELNKKWKSVSQAARDLNIAESLIWRVLNGIQYQTHGYTFIFLNKENSLKK